MLQEKRNSVAIIGGRGEFGQFLRQDILPTLGVTEALVVERDTPVEEATSLIQSARHVVLATPLAGYAERACDLIYANRCTDGPATFWFIPSVQAGVWRAVSATLEIVANPYLSAIFLHPMYGPNGFRETEPEARTFQNVLTATYAGASHALESELDQLTTVFLDRFNIATTVSFNPDEHDRITAYSQGLSYCVGRLMFDNSELDTIMRANMPDLHHSFRANHDLILDFVRINSYMPQVLAAFSDSWRQTAQSTFADIATAFFRADSSLNRGAESPIPTKWYERLRSEARRL